MSHKRARRRGVAPAALLAVMMIAAGTGSAPAQTPGVQIQPPGNPMQQNMPRSWYREYEYGVEVDGQRRQDVGLYRVVGKSYMLIHGPGLESSYVLTMRPKEVRAVQNGTITVKNDIEVVLAESNFLGSSPSPWANDGPTAVVFYGGSSRIRVARVPALVGEITLESLFENDPRYQRGMEQYSPDNSAIAKLKQIGAGYTIEVWFGSWCPHCQRVVPRFLKVMQAMANPNVDVVYQGVPRQFGNYQPARQKDVSGLPTFIVMRDGREYARFKGGSQKQTIEAEMAEVFASSTRNSGR